MHVPHVAPTCNEKRRSDIEACASGIQKLATGTWRRELIISPQPCLAELIISSRHFCVGSRRQHVVVFRGETHHLVAADAYGTHKLAVAPLLVAITSTRCPCATKAISPSQQWLAELISLLQQLSGGLPATRFRSMRAWAQIVGPLLHPRTRCAALATHTRRVELCMCHMWPLHAMKNADPTSRHVRVGFRS